MVSHGIGAKLRFEVFKRDAFTCAYCGRKAPDVILQVDHIKPKSKGGTNDLLNLITACSDCNAGKSNRELSDNLVLRQKRRQLEELQARKEQLQMMFEWQQELLALETETVAKLAEFWRACAPGYDLNDAGRQELRKLMARFEVDDIMEAMKIAAGQYLVLVDGTPTQDSVELAWKRVGGICRIRLLGRDNPALGRIYYIRGILRNRLNYVNERLAIELLRHAVELGAPVDSLEAHAKAVRNWTEWRSEIERFIESRGAPSE